MSIDSQKEPHKLVNPKTTDFDFPLNEQFEEKVNLKSYKIQNFLPF